MIILIDFEVKMNKRNALKVFIFLLYAVIIIIFFVFAKSRGSGSDKNFSCINSECVRFCKDDHNVTAIGSNGRSDYFELTNPVTNLTQNFRVIKGEPCERMSLLDTDQWTFSSVS